MDAELIRRLIRQSKYEYSIHAQRERLEEDLDIVEIEEALRAGEILEQYLNDPRGESCLMLGYAGAKSVHVVLGWASSPGSYEEHLLRVITVYSPQSPKWVDPRTRRMKE